MLCVACFMVCSSYFIPALGQTEPEYRLEVGGGVGAVTYLGDFNQAFFQDMQPMFSLVAKYRVNPRMSWALNVGYGRLKGSLKNEKTYYPELTDYSFSASLVDVGVRYEYNFWPFGTGMEYRGAQRITPYIYIGLGASVASPDSTHVGVNMPLGGGVKYKITDRMNLAVEWTMHFTNSDKLDGMIDPYGIKSSGLFKNTDCYSDVRMTLTYDLWAKCKTCHNDKD